MGKLALVTNSWLFLSFTECFVPQITFSLWRLFHWEFLCLRGAFSSMCLINFIFTDFYARGLKRNSTFFLPASFLAFVFHPRATKNTPNGKRALELIFYFVTEDYIYRFLGVNSWFEWNKSITKSLLLLPTVLPISLWKRPSRLCLT